MSQNLQVNNKYLIKKNVSSEILLDQEKIRAWLATQVFSRTSSYCLTSIFNF